jgi:hypothetical protein
MKSLNQYKSIKKLLVILTILNLVACDNKLDINAPYKQIPVIYGFVNKNEAFQFIRVQKVFQNSVDINAKDAAKISDSLYLPNLSVQIIYIKNNGRDTVNCTRIDSIDKNPGFFANDKNFIYRSNYYVIQPDVIKAALLVKDTVLGNTYTSECSIIGDQKIDSRNITVSDNPSNKFRFIYTLNKSAFMVDAAIRFNYFEYPIGDTINKKLKYYDYYLQSGLITSRLLENISISVISKVLLDDWRSYFKDQPRDVNRKFASVEYVTWGAGPEFLEIQEISKPNVSFVQKRTDYSNIKNALGIFAARTMNVQTDVTFDAASLDLISEMQQFEK